MKTTINFLFICFFAIFNSVLFADASRINSILKTFPFVGKCVQISHPSQNLCWSLEKGGASKGANIIPCNFLDSSQKICIAAGNGDNFLLGTRDCQNFLDNHNSMDGPGFMWLEPKNIKT